MNETLHAPTVARCPFCSTREILIVLYESPRVRVFPDIRPILRGHVLITPTTHHQSVEDLEPVDYWRLRVVQQEVARRMRRAWGGVASAYEHGRSAICRFHAADRGDTHAHVHVLPTVVDVLARSETAIKSPARPSWDELRGEERYIYQQLHGGAEGWGWRPTAVPRHFLRVGMQAGLSEAGQSFIPLDAPITEHLAVIEETAQAYRAHGASSASTIVLRGWEEAAGSRHAANLARALGAAAFDTALVHRLLVQERAEGDEARRLQQLQDVEDRFARGELGWAIGHGAAARVSLVRRGDELGAAVDPRLDAAARALAELSSLRAAVRGLVSRHAGAEARAVIADGRSTAAAAEAVELSLSLDDAEPSIVATEGLAPELVVQVLREALSVRTDGQVSA